MSLGIKSGMTIEQANQELEDSLFTRMQDIAKFPTDVTLVKKEAETTFKTIRQQTKALFGLGFFLIGLSVLLLILSVLDVIASDSMTSLEIFGIGTLGVADLFGLFFYKPIEVSKRAMEDFAQTVILVQGWLLSIELILRGVNIKDREMTMKAGALIQNVSAETVAALEKFLSEK